MTIALPRWQDVHGNWPRSAARVRSEVRLVTVPNRRESAEGGSSVRTVTSNVLSPDPFQPVTAAAGTVASTPGSRFTLRAVSPFATYGRVCAGSRSLSPHAEIIHASAR